MTTILVTGASGTLGAAVVPRLRADGHDVRAMSRRARPGWVTADLLTGTGLRPAVGGAEAIIHLASSPIKTRATDVEGTRRLLAAASDVRHFLYMSIIGIDRVPLPYYRMKLEAEAAVAALGIPHTLLRAAQFPTLIDIILSASSGLGPDLLDRNAVFQPVAVEDVADRIATLISAGPAGPVEFAGPECLTLDDLARQWLQARHSRRPIWPIRFPSSLGRELRAGALTTSAKPTGTRTWRDFLTARYQ